MDFEALLAQLLQQRALETKAMSDAKHGPVVAQLRMGNQPNAGYIQRAHPQDHMPVIVGHGQGHVDAQANDIAGLLERGQEVPEYMYNGLSPEDVARANAHGKRMHDLGGSPSIKPKVPGLSEATVQYPVGPVIGVEEEDRLLAQDEDARAANQRMKVGHMVNKDRRTGQLDAGAFDGLTHQEAARRISDMLMAERERQGDPSAWWQTFTTDF